MTRPTIKTVIWDFGGVLTTSPFEAFNRYEREHGLPRDFIRGVNSTNPDDNAWARLESNQVGVEEFDRLFAAETRAAGHEVAGEVVIGLLAGDVRPRMVQALERCKHGFIVACITNNVNTGRGPGMARSEEQAERVAEVMSLFDFIVESSIEGVRKPDPAIYRIACERAGIEPVEAVFLDDLGINLKPARALGMHTIKVVSEDQAIHELATTTGLKLD